MLAPRRRNTWTRRNSCCKYRKRLSVEKIGIFGWKENGK
jgi:hypothetical protein